jgi:hypothetical protein
MDFNVRGVKVCYNKLGDLDEIFAQGQTFHLERMGESYVWLIIGDVSVRFTAIGNKLIMSAQDDEDIVELPEIKEEEMESDNQNQPS